jgi:DegV family protein with EDD domain
MEYKIIVDSCCDITPDLKEKLNATTIPLTLTLGEKSFVDDESLNMPVFMEEMKNCKEKIGTAAPSPVLYKEAFEGSHASFAVTLSGNLSSSNSSALVGKSMIEKGNEADIHVFDSKSASAGEVLIALKIQELIDKGYQISKIVTFIENFIKNMKTYFVLYNINNLLKNGRLNKVVGKIVSTFNIKPVMGSDGNGNIALLSYARGQNQIMKKLCDTIRKSGKKTDGERLVIAHCNNSTFAQKFKDFVKDHYHFKDVTIVPMKGVSSVYANDKGVVIAF